MGRRKASDEGSDVLGVLGAYAIGGPALAGIYGASRVLREDGSAPDGGGAPIGSDPWLRAEVIRAIAKAKLPPGSITVEVKEMVVTLQGPIENEEAERRAVDAAKSVEGVASVRSELKRA